MKVLMAILPFASLSSAQNPGTGTFSFVQHQTFISDRKGSYFGKGVAISDDEATVAISAPYYDPSGNAFTAQGGVFIYSKQPDGSYIQVGGRLYGTGGSSAPWQGYTLTMSPDGSTLAWGGFVDKAVWVFIKSGVTYVQQTKLTPSYAGTSNLGFPVDLSSNGDVLIVGIPGDSPSQTNPQSGAVTIYRRSGGSWAQEARIAGDVSRFYVQLGTSVAINGAGTIVAASGLWGYIVVYAKIGSDWILQSPKVSCSSPTCDFGTNSLVGGPSCVDLSADGNWLIAGQGGSNENKNQFDYALYRRDTSDNNLWVVVSRGLVSTTLTGPSYMGTGCSISRDGTTFALVGGYNFVNNIAVNLAAFVFKIVSQTTVQQFSIPLVPVVQRSGLIVPDAAIALSSDGSKAIVGSAYNPSPANEGLSGSAWFFKYEENTYTPSSMPSKTPSTSRPSKSPTTSRPSSSPTTSRPSRTPSRAPTTTRPSQSPSTTRPTANPTTERPTLSPSTSRPTLSPTTSRPTLSPTTLRPSLVPTISSPSKTPTTSQPSRSPTRSPTRQTRTSAASGVATTAAIIGGSAGAIAFLALLAGVLLWYRQGSKHLPVAQMVTSNEIVDHRALGHMDAANPRADIDV